MTQQSFNLADFPPGLDAIPRWVDMAIAPTPGERAILDRILRHPNVGRFSTPGLRSEAFPATIAGIACGTHRYYLAHSPMGGAAVLRIKDQRGLEEWRTRHWTTKALFPDPPPTITDVTVQALEAVESSLSIPIEDFYASRTWVVVGDGCRFVFTTTRGPPEPGALPLWQGGQGIASALFPWAVRCPPALLRQLMKSLKARPRAGRLIWDAGTLLPGRKSKYTIPDLGVGF